MAQQWYDDAVVLQINTSADDEISDPPVLEELPPTTPMLLDRSGSSIHVCWREP